MFNPMLAATLPVDDDLSKLNYPVLASRKLDGVRATVQEKRLLSRNLKDIPNRFVQALFGRGDLNGLDGELILGDPCAPDCFRKTMSAVMSEDGEPEVTFWVIDRFDAMRPFRERLRKAIDTVALRAPQLPHWRIGRSRPPCIRMVEQQVIRSETELRQFETQVLTEGYEGVMLRSSDGIYKQSRSTLREWHLVKLKRFLDAEALVIGFEELHSNLNEQTRDAIGHAKRSSHKAGMVARGTLGALQVRDIKTGVKFSIGSGFTIAQRHAIWKARDKYLNVVVKYKFFPSGSKEKPRFPVYLGVRDARDV